MAMRFALAGNPNSGKTTLFNELTGATAHVGNWPGVTIDRKEGRIKSADQPVQLVDLPGIYSLSPYTPEEVISRNYLLNESPDLIINIVDVTNLARNLYLTTQLLELDIPMVIALNMMDSAKRAGDEVDTGALSKLFGVPVVPISALQATNMKELVQVACETAGTPRKGISPVSASSFAALLDKARVITLEAKVPHPLFQAVKLLEGDKLLIQDEKLAALAPQLEQLSEAIHQFPEGTEAESALAAIRHAYIAQHAQSALRHTRPQQKKNFSDRVDDLLMHRVLGIPIFLAFMFLMFHLTFGESLLGIEGLPGPGVYLQGLTETLWGFVSGGVAQLLTALNASGWVYGLVVDGGLAGVGAVLSFVPQIMLLFFFLSVLEDSGYMARAAFLMDRVLRRFGLSGRAFLPMLTGFGCSVPAIMSTRTLETEQDRRLTMLLIPYMSCGAKAPIWAIFAAALFPAQADFVVFGIYLLGILVAVLSALLLKRTLYKKEAAALVIELPPYRLPKAKSVVLLLWEKLKEYLLRAGTIILISSMAIWFLSSFSLSLQMVETAGSDSILSFLGGIIRWVFVPLGFVSGPDGWKAAVAVLTGLLAKEAVVSTLGVLYNPGLGDALESETAHGALLASLAATFSPLAALSFMAFNLLSIPCMAAVAAMRAEMRSGKWTWATLGMWVGTAWIVSFIIYQGGRLLGLA